MLLSRAGTVNCLRLATPGVPKNPRRVEPVPSIRSLNPGDLAMAVLQPARGNQVAKEP